jgi:hypothetical protein
MSADPIKDTYHYNLAGIKSKIPHSRLRLFFSSTHRSVLVRIPATAG